MHSATTAGGLLGSSLPDLAAQYQAVRNVTRELCAPLSAEDQMVQSMPDASPAKWHQAHTTWFFETFVLSPYAPGYRPFDPRFRLFFNSYYKQLGGHPVRTQRGLWSRPSLDEVLRYRSHVDEAMLRFLDGPVSSEVLDLMVLGCHHEQQHQELIVTDTKHALWTNPLRPSYRQASGGVVFPDETPLAPPFPAGGPTFAGPREKPGKPGPITWLSYDAGLCWIGHEGQHFAFDNESPRHQVFLQPFQIASRLVSNSEYLEFMSDGGYTRPDLWLSEGWDTVCAQGWRAPLYWFECDGQWMIYTLDGEVPLNPADPVCHISYYEADAFARWAGARIPTEFEWEVAAANVRRASQDQSRENMLDTKRLHPLASNLSGEAQHQTHPAQMFGDVWEWTASQYLPYPGFRPASGVVGEYNGKFMCNQFVLRGGSCATPADHIRATYRNFFPAHTRWQFAGIRLAK
ncbi:MAG TPA: ergothioneine biosynthesis protein EgtB [Terriglobales bacterium]|nr:ergothioneine biosynthesis protein EgtB [Terriglobales bacterium]